MEAYYHKNKCDNTATSTGDFITKIYSFCNIMMHTQVHSGQDELLANFGLKHPESLQIYVENCNQVPSSFNLHRFKIILEQVFMHYYNRHHTVLFLDDAIHYMKRI